MNKKLKYAVFVLSAIAILSSCKDDNNGPSYKGGTQGTAVSLQASSPVTIGMETDNNASADANYLQTMAANASQTTFSSAMTHGAVVQNDGTLNFTTPDTQMAAVKAANIQNIWGKALCWYQNQNATFLNTLVGAAAPNALADGNPDFEDWDDNQTATTWVWANGKDTYGTIAKETGATNVNHGSASMSMTIIQTVTSAGSSWHLQLVSAPFMTVAGHEYSVSFYAKTSVDGCYYQGEWDHSGNPAYTGGVTLNTAWTKYTMLFNGTNPKGTGAPTTISFDMAYSPVGAIIYLDNIVIVDETQALIDAQPDVIAARVDSEFKNWVNAMVTHYKGKVVGWDVITELFADDGTIRNNKNTSSSTATDWFVWSNYLGENIGTEAFNLAHAADPNALLFINESGLESNSTKLDALIAYVQSLQSQGVHIDGIGTSMHVNVATAMAGVDYMFQKLAATGLKIRISELDVSVNPNDIFAFVLTPDVLEFQAVTYHDVIASYLKNVPAAQRQDITVWGVNDSNSWLYNSGSDFPLLFDDSYITKPAFDGFLQALKGQ